jgi:hypothetical protein
MSKQKKKHKRWALTERNIREHTAEECAKAIRKNKGLRSKVLKTRTNTLGSIVFVPKSVEVEAS